MDDMTQQIHFKQLITGDSDPAEILEWRDALMSLAAI